VKVKQDEEGLPGLVPAAYVEPVRSLPLITAKPIAHFAPSTTIYQSLKRSTTTMLKMPASFLSRRTRFSTFMTKMTLGCSFTARRPVGRLALFQRTTWRKYGRFGLLWLVYLTVCQVVEDSAAPAAPAAPQIVIPDSVSPTTAFNSRRLNQLSASKAISPIRGSRRSGRRNRK
jgi:hypothetical protein